MPKFSDVTVLAGEIYTLQLTSVKRHKDDTCSLNLKGVLPMTNQRVCALVWILENRTYKFRKLILTGQVGFCRLLGADNFQTFLELPAFLPLEAIVLDKCNLDCMPKFDNFKALQTVDVSHNNLTSLPDFVLSSLRQIRLEGNPLPEVDFDPKNVPNLVLLSLGSTKTEIIGGRLIELSANNAKFCIEVDPKYRDYLIVPLVVPLYARPPSFGPVDTSATRQSGSERSSESFASSRTSRRMSLPATLARFNPRKTSSEAPATHIGTLRQPQRSMSLFAKSEKNPKPLTSRFSDTRGLLQNTLDVSYFHKKVKAVLDYTSIKNVQLMMRGILYVLESVNVEKDQHTLTLTSRFDLYDYLGPDGFNEFLRHDRLKHLNYLYLDNCNLHKFPDLTNLKELRYLNMSNNFIKEIDETMVLLSHLRHLDISKNPIENLDKIGNCLALDTLNIEETHIAMLHIDFTNGKLGKLNTVECGSEYLKYISHVTLRRKQINEKEFAIEVLEKYRTNLILPNYQTLVNRSLLHKFLGEQSLTDILNNDLNQNEYYEALMNLLNQGDQKFPTIDLTGHDVGSERLQVILNNPNSVSLTRLNLKRSNLAVVPDLTNLVNLEYLDIGSNFIESLKELKNTSLKTLVADGNLFSVLDFDPSRVPSLEEVRFGSEKCQMVSFQILQKASTGIPMLKLSEPGTQALIIPPPDILEKPEELEAYVQNTEMSLNRFSTSEPEKQYKSMLFTIEENKSVGFDVLNLAGETAFCKTVGLSGLQSITGRIPKITKLDLSDCQLDRIPDIEALTELQILTFNRNNISSVETMRNESVVEIDLQYNPIPGINLNRDSIPSLKVLKIGSPETKYVSLSVLSEVSAGTLEVQVASEHTNSLVFPPASFMSDAESLASFVDSASLDLTTVSIEEPNGALEWVLKNSGPALKSLIMSNFIDNSERDAALFSIFEEEKDKLVQLRYLTAQNLGLKSLPDLSNMNNLLAADFSHNYIESIESKIGPASQSLTDLNLTMNPIVAFNTDFSDFPALTKLSLGSPQTKYICHPLLEAMSKLDVKLHESAEASLLYPTYKVATDKASRRKFTERKELNLKKLETSDKNEAFNWCLKDCRVTFRSLCLSKEDNLLEEFGMSISNCLETFECLHDLKEIYLDECGLETVPKLSSLHQLKVVDLRLNKIANVETENFPSSLKEIRLEGNQIQCLDIDCEKLPNLKSVGCGSEHTHYITTPLARLAYKSKLTIDVPEDCREYLYMPSAEVLGNKEKLVKYIENPEKFLIDVVVEHRSEALQWLFTSSKSDLLDLDFTAQDWLFRSDSHVDTSCINVQNVNSLNLSGCGLKLWPRLNGMSGLKKLNLSNNGLIEICPEVAMSSLERLDITQNLIHEIDFDINLLPELKHLTFGSNETKFVSIQVLNQTLTGKLTLSVLDALHKQCLLLPSWNTIEIGRDTVQEYISSKVLGQHISHIANNEEKRKAISWQLDKSKKTFTVVDFSCETKFCHSIQQDLLPVIFGHESLRAVTEINLSSCNLDLVPDWSKMHILTSVDLSGNNVTNIPASQSLQTLNIIGCQIKVLSLEKSEFPNLKNITAGSDCLEFISFEILKRVTVPEIYQKSLIMPPACVFNRNENDMYLKEPEKYLVHVDGKLLAQAVEWLFNEADYNFKELDLSGQEGIFKLSKTELPGNTLHGKNLRNVTLLNVSNCHLDDSILSKLKHLPELQTFLISGNDLTDVSTLEHPKLTNIDVTGNPVPVIDIDFEQCPGLVKINVGSLATRALSLKVMERICLGRLLVDVAESYKTNMVIPPPYIIKNHFNKKQVEEYLNSGVFDVSWFMSESFMQEEDLVSAILDILSMDKRNLRVFKMCKQPDCASKIGPRIDELFTCTTLDDIEQLDLSENNLTHTPLCPSLTKLHTVNLSGNNLGSGTGKFQDGINVLGAVTHLNISHCHLDQVA